MKKFVIWMYNDDMPHLNEGEEAVNSRSVLRKNISVLLCQVQLTRDRHALVSRYTYRRTWDSGHIIDILGA